MSNEELLKQAENNLSKGDSEGVFLRSIAASLLVIAGTASILYCPVKRRKLRSSNG